MDSHFDSYFNHLDKLQPEKNDNKTCCDNHSNYITSDGIIVCSVCDNTINNIMDSPKDNLKTFAA